MSQPNARKKHTFAVTVSFDQRLNEREALDAAKELLGGFGGYASYRIKARGAYIIAETNGNVTSVRRASVG